MLKYIDLVKKAKENGTWNEKTMWRSVESISDMLEAWKQEDLKSFWAFMREQHGILNGGHYDEQFAMHDVEKMSWKDKNGDKRHGAYWTLEQVMEAMKDRKYPEGTTIYDVFVAYNASATDLCRKFSDKEIVEAADLEWFDDADWSESGSATKIWDYMSFKLTK